MSVSLAWTAVLAAGVLGAFWALSLKQTASFQDPAWVAVSLLGAAMLVVLLATGMRVLPAGVAFAAWSGIAVLTAALAGAFVLGERLDSDRALWMGLIVLGVVGLRFGRLV